MNNTAKAVVVGIGMVTADILAVFVFGITSPIVAFLVGMLIGAAASYVYIAWAK